MPRSLCSLYPTNTYYDFQLHFLLVCLQNIETLVHVRCFPKLGMHYVRMPKGGRCKSLKQLGEKRE